MKTQSLFGLYDVFFLVVLGLLAGSTTYAEEFTGEGAEVQQVSHFGEPTCECEHGGCADSCCGDCCRKVCVATVETEKVEKHRWKTETKDVCIPKVVLPWQEGGSGLTLFSFLKKHKSAACGDVCCGDTCGGETCCCLKPRCGKVITVCDLKKEKYEKEECVCKWKIRRLPSCRSGGCCEEIGCGDTCDGNLYSEPSWTSDAAPVSDEVQLASLFTLKPSPAKAEPQVNK